MEKEVYTEVEGQRVKLTHLDKVIYPAEGIIKAEIIQYFLDVSEYLLPFLKNRALTLIRYPDGIDKETFYSKNMPKWTPEWVDGITLKSDSGNRYVVCNKKATLVWLGNLSALEIHPQSLALQQGENPDFFIVDLDPSEEVSWEGLKTLTLQIKAFLEEHGYAVFLKTSGGKGLHLYVPILPAYDVETLFASVKTLFTRFVKLNPGRTTLHISKERRKSKVLIDIFRNRKSQTCVAPYSLRGKPGAPISMPLRWDDLPDLASSQDFTIRNAGAYLKEYGPVWSNFRNHAVELHDQKKAIPALESYYAKRDFTKSPEPQSSITIAGGHNRYVIQMHDARRLHFDLRLEKEGTLKSWAIPKGLPTKLGVKRLAIQTEDHPLSYLTFAGIIPKGQYGAGSMWVFDAGSYEVESWEEGKCTFALSGKWRGKYRMYHTGDDQWLVERLDDPVQEALVFIKPMLAIATETLPETSDYSYEVKWDGIRLQGRVEEQVTLISRSGRDITSAFPEIETALGEASNLEDCVYDGECVVLDERGRPLFHEVVGRMHLKQAVKIESASRSRSAVYYIYDVMKVAGIDVTHLPQHIRHAFLSALLDTGESIRISESMEDGKELFAAVKSIGMEGIMCKVKDAPYEPGKRSPSWLKLKVRNELTAALIGYTDGEGDRAGSIGALHVAQKDGEEWNYIGKVGTGFDAAILADLNQKLKALSEIEKPIEETIEEPRRTHWVEPLYEIDLVYASWSSNGTLREPVYRQIRVR